MQINNYDVIIKDIAGNVLFEFNNVKARTVSTDYRVVNGKVIENNKIKIECVADSIVNGDVPLGDADGQE